MLVSIAVVVLLLAMSIGAVQASWWALRGPTDHSASLAPAYRMALVWILASVGPAIVTLCARYPRPAPLFTRKRALPWAPWLATGVIVWFAFCYWLGMMGAGASSLALAFAVVLCCASVLSPVAVIGLAFKRRGWTLLLPALVLSTAVALYAAQYDQFFGR